MEIIILRLGHRIGRDQRLTSHLGLTARAFGASEIIISGEKDQKIIDSLNDVAKRFGGPFRASYEKNWKKVIKNFRGTKVHLTVYGLPVQDEIKKIRKIKDLLIIVGGEKVPGEVYHSVDYNISVTSQPHSEVAALSIFLDRYFEGKEFNKKFKNAKLKIKPCKVGKNILKIE